MQRLTTWDREGVDVSIAFDRFESSRRWDECPAISLVADVAERGSDKVGEFPVPVLSVPLAFFWQN